MIFRFIAILFLLVASCNEKIDAPDEFEVLRFTFYSQMEPTTGKVFDQIKGFKLIGDDMVIDLVNSVSDSVKFSDIKYGTQLAPASYVSRAKILESSIPTFMIQNPNKDIGNVGQFDRAFVFVRLRLKGRVQYWRLDTQLSNISDGQTKTFVSNCLKLIEDI
jgi:hypothetical protein